MLKFKSFIVFAVLLLLSAQASAGILGAKVTVVHPGAGNYFEIKVDSNHFNGCGYFDMGKFETTDQKKLERTYAAVLTATAAKQDVIIWYNDATPCVIDAIFVQDL